MRPTPFSDVYPESYYALTRLAKNLRLTPDYWKRQYCSLESKHAKEYAKRKFCERSTLSNPMAELQHLDEESGALGGCKNLRN